MMFRPELRPYPGLVRYVRIFDVAFELRRVCSTEGDLPIRFNGLSVERSERKRGNLLFDDDLSE